MPAMAYHELAAWKFESKGLQLLLLMHNKLNKKLTRECAKAIRERNGSKLHRKVPRGMGIVYEGTDFKLDLEIRDRAFRQLKTPADLIKPIAELEMLRDEYHEKVDKVYPQDQLHMILWRLLDPATLKDAEEKRLGDGQSTYEHLKNFVEERQRKETAKKEFHRRP